MCTRFCLTSTPDAVRALLGTVNDEQFPPRENIAPTQPVLIARVDPRGQRLLELVRWGLVPSWAKDLATLPLLINVQAEVALDKPTWVASMRYRRCLVPADGYYDWTGPKGNRQPHLIGPRQPGPIAFAGLWAHWLGADGSELESMAILTVPAGPDVAHLGMRSPAMLGPDRFADWLDCRGCPAATAAGFLRSAGAGTLESAAVDRATLTAGKTGRRPDDPDRSAIA